jgi:hypothetical protein
MLPIGLHRRHRGIGRAAGIDTHSRHPTHAALEGHLVQAVPHRVEIGSGEHLVAQFVIDQNREADFSFPLLENIDSLFLQVSCMKK